MGGRIYVLIDHGEGKTRNQSLETLALGQKLAAETERSIHAVLLTGPEEKLSSELASRQLDSVLVVSDERLEQYDPDTHSSALGQVLTEDVPDLFLMAHIYQNIDLAPKLAASLGKGLVTDCIGYKLEGGDLLFIRQMFRNKLNADIRVQSAAPWIVTVQSGACTLDDLIPGSAPIEKRIVDLSGVNERRRNIETIEATRGRVDLTKADVVVGVGRGIKKGENLEIIRELADVLGGEIGASRPVVDNEWMERERQIGSSGQSVSPRLYVACGVSGAIQHVVGMKSSNCIVAINTDPNAPIFNIATYGIVGDLFEVVPKLTKLLREG